jgi:hypothetical protein
LHENLQPGIYFIFVVDEEGAVETIRLIKQ